MTTLTAAIITALVIIFGTRAGRNEFLTYPLILVGMPFFYVACALYGDRAALWPELLVAVPFIGAALLSCGMQWRGNVYLLALGWLAHGLYDLSHDLLFSNAAVPAWYGMFCGVIDLMVCAYLLGLAHSLPNRDWRSLKGQPASVMTPRPVNG